MGGGLVPIVASSMAEVREAIAAKLAGAPVTVHSGPLDAVAGPCLIVGWGEPWLEPGNAATAIAHPSITAVAGRVDAGAGLELLEELVHYALGVAWTIPMGADRVESPALTTFANVEYLTARIILTTPLLLRSGNGK
jgi:hypothetical protein